MSEDVQKRLDALRKQADKAEAERLKLEKLVQESRKDAVQLIPQLKEEMAGYDTQITELQAKRSAVLEQLKLLGEKMSVKGTLGKRGGGLAEKFNELIRNIGVGNTVKNEEIEEYVGSHSGYVGMTISAAIKAGYIQRTAPGTYEVLSLP
jgi:uncharacterized coiled-coil DUF342 family protein